MDTSAEPDKSVSSDPTDTLVMKNTIAQLLNRLENQRVQAALALYEYSKTLNTITRYLPQMTSSQQDAVIAYAEQHHFKS